MFNRKVKKFIRDPKLFLDDMVRNKKDKITKLFPKKVNGNYQYTIVSAVYNVEKYLDDFFKSLIEQKLDFNNHIKLIMVDDGSTDNSSAIINKWVKKYPDNIFYIYKENSGQSSARNVGLEYVNSEWVTFIDPDDFLDVNYFYNIDGFIFKNKEKNLSMLGCNVVFYFENNNKYKDAHPLGFKFKNGNVCMPIRNIGKNIQLSASTAIFKTDVIKNKNIKFDPDVKPAFEDAKFVQEYLLDLDAGECFVGFLRDSKYFYRKREDGTSTLDTAWQKVERFTTTPKNGYLKIINKCYSKYGYVPEYIQRTLIYEITWHLKWLLNHQERASFLTNEQKEEYINNLKQVFRHIEKKNIINFELSGCWFFHKVGLLSFFKDEDPDTQIVYVEKYDQHKKLVQLRYFSRHVDFECFNADGVDVIPLYTKNISHEFLGRNFVTERRLWFFVGNSNKINFNVSDLPTRLSLSGKQTNSGFLVSDIIKYFNDKIPKYEKVDRYLESWLLMDRDIQADDNAEHLYRYIKKEHPKQKIFFILRRESHDWDRLNNEGFNLIEYASHDHEMALKSCAKVISSHADKYITNYLGPKMLEGRHYVFLQHGVTKDDISNWLNQKENIDCLITASPFEYESIVNDGTRYYYNEKEVVLTGFPRHDRLIEDSNKNERLIIIMPTWRNTIVGAAFLEGNIRQLNPDFMNTKFAISWSNLIHSKRLKELSERAKYKIAFFPHANIQPYLSEFNVPEYIDIISHTNGSIQEIFSKASVMITDYSSVAFEMAVQNKQTLYYQFDEDEIYTGGHFYSKGYFDYRKHGFGPVVNDEKSLLKELENIFEKNARPSDEVLCRINKTFPHRDGLNCERTYNAILSLDFPVKDDSQDLSIIRDYAVKASEHKRWDLADVRWSKYLSNTEMPDIEAKEEFITALIFNGRIADADSYLNKCVLSNSAEDEKVVLKLKLKFNLVQHQWKSAIDNMCRLGLNHSSNIDYLTCLCHYPDITELSRLLLSTDENHVYLKACNAYAHQRWEQVINIYASNINDINSDLYSQELCLSLLLLVASSYRYIRDFDGAHKALVEYETLSKNNIQCRYEIARLSFERHKWNKVISQIDKVSNDVGYLPPEFIYYYIFSIKKVYGLDKAASIYHRNNLIVDCFYMDYHSVRYHANVLMVIEEWSKAAELWSEVIKESDCFDDLYQFALALNNSGAFEKAHSLLKNNNLHFSNDGWLLRTQLAQLNDDWMDAYISWRGFLRAQPLLSTSDNVDKLQRLKLLSEISKASIMVK
ncbi:TPA: CDP-glycerol glycerophosphotransferase family protein [Citrobacter freundii]|nr:CDP-glycerol glycerophosphotransferase family protein [Citrobacter freundii]